MAKGNTHPVKAKLFGWIQHINPEGDCIDKDFDEEVPLYLLMPRDIMDDVQTLN